MNPYEMFKTNTEVEAEKGINLDYGAFSIRIVRAGGANKKFGKLLNDRLKPYRRQIDNDTIGDGIADKIMAETYADSIIIGWEGVTDPGGKKLEYSRANCVKLLLDLPELFRDIQEQAAKAANFKTEEVAADVKNSKSSSAGT